ncbi:MAG: acyltransferase family protein [Flammeovirgaceae bacterium]
MNKSPLAKDFARVNSLELLRGMAALGVVLFHYTSAGSIQLSDQNPLRAVGLHGHLGVQIFFVISGFVIPYSMHVANYNMRAMGTFLKKRIIRVEAPYLVLIALEVVFILLASFTPWANKLTNRLDAQGILLHLAFLNDFFGKPWLIPVFWTLAIEFQFYLFIAVFFPLLQHTQAVLRVGSIVVVAALGLLFSNHTIFFFHASFFLLGLVALQYKLRITTPREFILLLLLLTATVYWQYNTLNVLVAVFSVGMILFFEYEWEWASFLGMVSYSLYLIHVPFGGRLLKLTQLYVHNEWIKSLLIIIYVPLTVLIAWLFFAWVEKPFLSISKRLTYKHKNRMA